MYKMKLKSKKTVETAGVALVVAAFLLLGPTYRAAAEERITDKISIVPFVITAQPFPGAPSRTDESAEISRLQEEAASQATRTMTDHRLAKEVMKVSNLAAAQTPLVVTGTIVLPVSVTSNMNGMAAYEHRGDFATATATVQRPNGQVIATSRITLGWRAVWWGAGKFVRHVPFDTTLADYTRKATDKAVRSVFHDPAVRSLNDHH